MHLQPSTFLPFSRLWRCHIGGVWDTAHSGDDNYEASVADETGMDHNFIDTTSLNNVLDCLPLFILSNSALVTMVEEYVHILLPITKYHAKAVSHFYFRYFSNIYISFWSPTYESPKIDLKSKSANVVLNVSLARVGHRWKMHMYHYCNFGFQKPETLRSCKSNTKVEN